MATRSQRRIVFGLLFFTYIAGLCVGETQSYYDGYSNRGSRSVDNGFEVVLLSDRHNLVRRQTSSSSNNLSSGKVKSDEIKASQKLDKNSASIPSDTPSSSVKKNLSPPLDETKDEFDDAVINDLTRGNVTEVEKVYHDHHLYYNSTLVLEPERIDEFWIDVERMQNVKTHDMLSKSYRRAATVPISFDFPFYGHMLRNATIATGGFLYLGDYMHSWLASTQYIAPLMANFDTRLQETSVIRYADNGTDFIVQWEDTFLQDLKTAGPFTFQVRLRYTGDIIFAYKKIPVAIKAISDTEHPVRVGVSDAYIIDRVLFLQRRKIIYEYHRVEIKKEYISNLTAVILTALPSCITIKDCESCLSTHITFECSWCPQAQRCSDGMDRYRHDWLLRGCDMNHQVYADQICPLPTTLASVAISDAATEDLGGWGYSSFSTESLMTPSPNPLPADMLVQSTNNGTTLFSSNTTTFTATLTTTFTATLTTTFSTSLSSVSSSTTTVPLKFPDFVSTSEPDRTTNAYSSSSGDGVSNVLPQTDDSFEVDRIYQGKSTVSAAGIIGILFIVALTIGIISWIIYAYRYPHTSSGQLIIKYRPSQWHWLKGEADYTPASVHI